MSIGLCCQWMECKTSPRGNVKWYNALEERNLQFGAFKNGKYNNEEITSLYVHNISKVAEYIPKFASKGLKSFRLSSNLLPLIDVVDESVKYSNALENALKNLGTIALRHNMRVTQHPSQFCLLASKNEDVIKNSFQILDHHAWIFDKMGLAENTHYAINIHAGVKDQFGTLVDSINKLPNNVRNRLTLENEELAYSVEDLYRAYKETGIPVIFDSHHHSFRPGTLDGKDAMEMAISTWKEKPLTHLSNTEPGFENGKFQDRRKHSNYVHYIPQHQLEANNNGRIDIDFEFKMKNESIFKAVNDFGVLL